MNRLIICIEKLKFLFRIWKFIQVKEKIERSGKTTYITTVGNSNYGDIVTYDLKTKDVMLSRSPEELIEHRRTKQLRKSLNLLQ